MITLQNILDIAEPALKLAALKGYSVDKDLGADPYATAFVDSTKIAAPKKRQKMRAQCVCNDTVYKINSVTKLQIQKKMIKCPECKIRKLYLIMSDI